ncbi:MAG: hypothetical protein KAZ26_24460 [Caldilineaceae bacterium]|nr:hypothetical protein [Caldilineaceae bacterium]
MTQATWENPWRRGVGGDAWLTDHAYLGYGGDMPINAPAYAGGGASRFDFAQPSIQATGTYATNLPEMRQGPADRASYYANPATNLPEMRQGPADRASYYANPATNLPDYATNLPEMRQGPGLSREDADLLQWAKAMRRHSVRY